VVGDIPDQTIVEGASFATINLDDYVTDADNTDDQMTWTYSGESELTVSIDGNRVATITTPGADWSGNETPGADWSGNETITFRATDPGLLYAEDDATFTVIENTPPLAPVVGITPALPLTDEDLIATITTESTDPDGDTVTYTYEWYKDDVLQPDQTKTDTTDLTDTVSSTLTATGETWKCVVTPNDGTDNGPSAEDQIIIVESSTTQTITDDILDAKAEADTEVSVNGTATVTVAKYPDNPGTNAGFGGDISKYVDVYISDVTGVNEITIKLYYIDADITGKVESSLKLYWWNGITWAACSDTSVNMDAVNGYSGYIWAKIRDDTTPSLDDLSGTPFGATASTPPPPDTSGGGGGGGGGGGDITSLSEYTTSTGKIVVDVTASSADGLVKIEIPKGTIVKDRNGNRLRFISIKPKDASPPPDNYEFVAKTYDITPSGSTFDPSVHLTITYDESRIPLVMAEENLVIGTWQDDKWIIFEGCEIDPVKNTIKASIDHLSHFSVMARRIVPPSFEIYSMEIDSKEVNIGDTVTIIVNVQNTGELTGNYKLIIYITDLTHNNLTREEKMLTIDGGLSQTVSFIFNPRTNGEYKVDVNGLSSIFNVKIPIPEDTVVDEVPLTQLTSAIFTVSDFFITPTEINPSEKVTISALITNIGDRSGSYSVVLKIDNNIESKKEISLDPGKSERVSFNTSRDMVGIYTIDVNGQSEQLIVKSISLPTSEPNTIIPENLPKSWLLIVMFASMFVFLGTSFFLYKKLPR